MKSLLLFFGAFLCTSLNAQITVYQSDLSVPANYIVWNSGGGDWVVTNSGPTGSTAQFMGPMNSSTPTEFALFDSQAFGGQQSAGIEMTDFIDISAYSYAYVCFQSYYKHDAGTCNLQVSNDAGVSWINFSVHDALPQGDSTANPSMELIDISAVGGLQSTVKIRFVYEGPAGFAWMVDDICVLANNSPIIGLEENEDQLFKIFPNPSNGTFTVDLHKIQGEAEVRITDLQGRLVSSQIAGASMQMLDVELNEAPGTYLVTVIHSSGQTTKTIVKK